MNFRVDNLQYCNWSRKIFEINHQAKLDAVHATICYHEDFDELKIVLKKWDQHFKENSDLIFLENLELDSERNLPEIKRNENPLTYRLKQVLNNKFINI